MTSLAQINENQVSIINFKSIPVITTEMLAGFYETETVRIQQNHTRNRSRFIEGKHFFKLVGQELKDFVTSLKIVAKSPKISNKARSLILWTERGAARHAKMLDTDQAWEVFEQLEDCYFYRKEVLRKTHKEERAPLTSAVNLLVAKTKHLNYSEAYKLVHQRFNVEHIEDIPYSAISNAVEYVHYLIALYSKVEEKSPFGNNEYELVREFIETVLKQNTNLQHIWNALRYIDTGVFLKCSRFVVDTNVQAKNLSKVFDFRTKENEPLLEESCRWISLSSGERLDTNPNFFNCEA